MPSTTTSPNYVKKTSQVFGSAIEIVRDTIDLCFATEKAYFVAEGSDVHVEDSIPGATFDTVLKNGTAKNKHNAQRRYCNHGLVFGDYYRIEFGNRLLDMGLA